MKKLMIAAMMLLGTSAAFAGDSEPLKAILKAKTYAEAEQLVKSNLSQLANDAEKAKAYNKLVELALKLYNEQKTIETENSVMIQMGQNDKVKPYDTIALGDAAINAIDAAIECAKYDQLPNEKGKIKPLFSKNVEKLTPVRLSLVNTGIALQNDKQLFLKYIGKFLDTEDHSFFASVDKSNEKDYRAQIAFFASYYANMDKMYDKSAKWADYAINDSTYGKDAFSIKLSSLSANLKTREDSVVYEKQLEDLYPKYQDNNVVVSNLYSLKNSLMGESVAEKFLDEILVANPNGFIGNAIRGQNLSIKGKFDEAIPFLKKAKDADPKNSTPLTLLGVCYQNKASQAAAVTTANVLLDEAIKYYELAKQVDPEKRISNWGYFRYQAYYARYGANDAKTKDAELDK